MDVARSSDEKGTGTILRGDFFTSEKNVELPFQAWLNLYIITMASYQNSTTECIRLFMDLAGYCYMVKLVLSWLSQVSFLKGKHIFAVGRNV